jgi:hypothetical protein
MGVSYDDVPAIRRAYRSFRSQRRTIGREIIFVSDDLKAPAQRKLQEAAYPSPLRPTKAR